MTRTSVRRVLEFACALALLFSAQGFGNAAIIAVSGNWGAGGYDVVDFTVTSTGIVDFQYTGGYSDPTFSLFDGAGNHLITNDDDFDVGTLYSHLTQNLAAGQYELLVSYCCDSIDYVESLSAAFSSTDGFNDGSYWIGGLGTLSGMKTYLDVQSVQYNGAVSDQPYALVITSDGIVEIGQNGTVPEPASMAIWGLGAFGFAIAGYRRRWAA